MIQGNLEGADGGMGVPVRPGACGESMRHGVELQNVEPAGAVQMAVRTEIQCRGSEIRDSAPVDRALGHDACQEHLP